MEVLSVRVPEKVKREIEELARLEGKDRAEVAREALLEGLREKRIKAALGLYREGRVSLWKAARLAGFSLWELVEELERRGVELQYGEKELEEDLKAVLSEGGC